MAEAVRFELTEDSHPRQFSRLLHSTALPRFRARSLTAWHAGFAFGLEKIGPTAVSTGRLYPVKVVLAAGPVLGLRWLRPINGRLLNLPYRPPRTWRDGRTKTRVISDAATIVQSVTQQLFTSKPLFVPRLLSQRRRFSEPGPQCFQCPYSPEPSQHCFVCWRALFATVPTLGSPSSALSRASRVETEYAPACSQVVYFSLYQAGTNTRHGLL